MRFHVPICTTGPLFCVGAAAVLVAMIIAVAGVPAQLARADSSGLAYDEVVKIVFGNQTPEPGTYAAGSFAADFQAAAQAGASKKHGGIFGAITMAKEAMNSIKVGTASTYYYLGGLERKDDPSNHTATIYRPDRHQVMHLDLADKTYSIEDTGARMLSETPPPYQPPTGPGGAGPSPVPGTAKVSVTVATSNLGSKMIENEQTAGYKLDFKLASTEATGSCVNGTFGTTMIEFLSRYAEPTVGVPSGGVSKRPSAMPNPETMSMRPGCRPTFTAHVNIGHSPPTGRLSLWTLAAISAGMQSTQGQGPASGGISTLLERGNVRALGGADRSLFEVPAGFTKAAATPAP